MSVKFSGLDALFSYLFTVLTERCYFRRPNGDARLGGSSQRLCDCRPVDMLEPAIYTFKIEPPTVADFESWQLTGLG